MNVPLLDIRHLEVSYRTARGTLTAVDDLSLTIKRGQTLALIGESGCGKTSLGKTVVGLNHASRGQILFDGHDLATLTRRQFKPHRGAIQMVFQDPLSALDPRQRVYKALDLPLRLHSGLDKRGRQARIQQLLQQVGLSSDLAQRFPHELSGGQRQRLNIARALATEPRLIVCDEPVSALDVSLQAQIVALLRDLQQQLGLAYLFISHDLSVVAHIADDIAVMYLGRIVEILPAAKLWSDAAHPYTRLLLDSVPRRDPGDRHLAQLPVVEGDPPSPYAIPAGCRFQSRCPQVMSRCHEVDPALEAVTPGHRLACHLSTESLSPAQRIAAIEQGLPHDRTIA